MNDQAEALVAAARDKYLESNPADALVDFDAAMRLGADGYDVWRLRESILFALERAAEALEAAEMLIQLEPENPEGYEIKAGIFTNLLSDLDRGELFARTAYRLLPQQAHEDVRLTGNEIFSLLTYFAEEKGQPEVGSQLQRELEVRGFGLEKIHEDFFGGDLSKIRQRGCERGSRNSATRMPAVRRQAQSGRRVLITGQCSRLANPLTRQHFL